jgi:hypothetical protein
MSNRCCSTVIVFLALAGNAETLSAQTSAVQVQVYDYADLNPGSLHKALALTQEILAEAGVSVQVKLCRGARAVPCESEPGSTRSLLIRVVAGGSKTKDSVVHRQLGQSIADREGGTYSSVFLERIQDAAAEANVPWDIVLAYAAAHEAGHLLLGSEAHTARGVMKAHWGREDFEAMNQHQFHFIDQQAHDLANRYGRSPLTGPAVKLASGDSRHTARPGQ